MLLFLLEVDLGDEEPDNLLEELACFMLLESLSLHYVVEEFASACVLHY
jgi:hypothetical protein